MNFTVSENQIVLYGVDQKLLAEVTFPAIDARTVDLNRVFVDDSLRGQGIAGKLMEAVVDVLTIENKKTILTCPYALKWFEAHPEYRDLVC